VLHGEIELAQAACFAEVPKRFVKGEPEYGWCS
jgi:hypothetical protein